MKPKDLVDIPDLEGEADDKEILERTLTKGWMESWLVYRPVGWYCTVALDPWVSLDDFLSSAPIVTHRWNRDENLERFGFQWKLYAHGAVGKMRKGFHSFVLTPLLEKDNRF